MIEILTVDEAKKSVLKRKPQGEEIPPALRAGLQRVFGEEITPQEGVRTILKDIRERGDQALQEWTEKIDRVRLDDLVVPRDQWPLALERLPKDLQKSLRLAAERIRAFHARQPIPSWSTTEMGGVLGQNVTALKRVGVYVPGGSAPLPSSLLMSAIPAQVAGVSEIYVATPPGKSGGAVPDVILAAAYLAGVTKLFRIGGAQAIGALAFGTAVVPKVDKIVGAGNLFVTLAKQQVFGQVGLDGLAGPTETVVVADDTANPAWVAADLLAQAEHDMLATPILFTPSRKLAQAVQAEVIRQYPSRSRQPTLATSLAGQGAIVVTKDIQEGVVLADEYAPEHLCLSVAEPEKWAKLVRNAGGLFLGEHSCEVLGDYVAGPSHVMPTGGTARFASPLNVLDFVRITNVIALDDATSTELSKHAAIIAQAESLDSHAQAAIFRAEDSKNRTLEASTKPADPALSNSSCDLSRFADLGSKIEPYQPVVPFEIWAARLGRPPESIVKLDANENPYGPARGVAEIAAAAKWLNIYPDPDSTELRKALEGYVGVPAERLFAGAGADELIELVLRALVKPGDVVIDCPPTFGMYSFFAQTSGARVLNVKRRADFSLDIEGIEAAVANEPRAKVLFLCSPNNPDGSTIPEEVIRRLLKLPVLVVLDEAYVEFHGTSCIKWVLERNNLAVLRTFSKWAGLAGLRVGYGAFPKWVLEKMWPIKQPYNVNVAAAQAAVASLKEVGPLLEKVELLRKERERLFQLLGKIDGLTPFPSRSNFILCRLARDNALEPVAKPSANALEVKQKLETLGVLIRHFNKEGVRDCLRISVGRPQDTDALIAALEQAGLKARS